MAVCRSGYGIAVLDDPGGELIEMVGRVLELKRDAGSTGILAEEFSFVLRAFTALFVKWDRSDDRQL